MNARLKLERLTFAYEESEPVFEGIDFTAPACSAWWIKSDGHRGRSTLLKLLAGLIKPTAGRYLIDDVSVGDLSFEDFLPFRLKIGYGFDMGGLLNTKSVFDNLELPLLYHGLCSAAEARRRVRSLLERFSLDTCAKRRPFEITGSQRKLVCVLRALVHQPELALLDEPLTGLKSEDVRELIAFLRDGFATKTLGTLVFTGEAEPLARAFDAAIVNVSRTRIFTKDSA